MTTAPQQPVVSYSKGEGNWVDQVFSDPVNKDAQGKPVVLRVQSWTLSQIQAQQAQLQTQYTNAMAGINAMLNLLVPPVQPPA